MATENLTPEGKPAPSPREAKSGTSGAAPEKAKKKERKVVEVTNDLPPVWSPAKEGDFIEGFYVGPRVINYRGKPFLTHVIQNEDDGELLSFSGAIADRKMTRLPKGSWCRVVFKGEQRTSGGYDAKDYSLSTEEHVRLLDESEALTIARDMISAAKSS